MKLVEDPERVDVSDLLLKHVLSFTVKDAITFLVNTNLLKNSMQCEKCHEDMKIQKRSNLQDGLEVL
jgi:hypothetical protein